MKTLDAIQNQNKKIAVVGLGWNLPKRFLLSGLTSTKKNWIYIEKASILQKKQEMKL